MGIDSKTEIAIHEWQKKLIAIHEIRNLISDEMGKLIKPILEQHNLDLDLELQELLTEPGYWRFEVIRRVKALKALQEK